MGDEVRIAVDGAMGVITLDRPRAINALTVEMLQAIGAALTEWRDDDRVGAVLFEGAGERGFCAGGDVRYTRDRLLAGDVAAADAYFALEYSVDGMIATYAKPVVALIHGVCMGGGVGLASHADVRIAAADARFAMPEAAIGLMCDVGVNALLAMVPEHRALAFQMAGLPVGAGDALALDLADVIVGAADFAALRGELIAAADTGRAGLRQVADARALAAPDPVQGKLADRLAHAFAGENAAAIVSVLGELSRDDEARAFAQAVQSRSPTSLEVIVASHRAARRRPDVSAVLARDLRLAQWLVRRPDFIEGVRAVLIDKDQQPRWNPSRLSDVATGEIFSLFQGSD